MPAINKTIKFILLLMLMILFADTGCAPSKNRYYEKRMKASRVNTSQLGRNRYYFSPTYQKKLYKGYKRK